MRNHPARTTSAAVALVAAIALSFTAGSLVPGAGADNGRAAADSQARGVPGYKLLKASATVAVGEGRSLKLTCPKGRKVVGSGGSFDHSWDVIQTVIEKRGRVVLVYGKNDLGAENKLRGWAVCASVG